MNWIMLAVAAALSIFTHAASAQQLEKAIFAGGCFWCVESDFDKVPGVVATISGYTGGKTENPTYKQVSVGGTGHYEAVEITYDPAKVSYETLTHRFLALGRPDRWRWPVLRPRRVLPTRRLRRERESARQCRGLKERGAKETRNPDCLPDPRGHALLRCRRLSPELL